MNIWSKWIFIFLMFFVSGLAIANNLPVPSIHATAAVLINAENGEVLFSKNANKVMAPASTTKMMTAILAIEKGNLDKSFKVSRIAAAKPGSSMYLHRGEVQTLRTLLYGLMLASGNDSAAAIAEAISGSEVRFAQLMTLKAKKIGMRKTQFKNASGLPAVNHYTTAYDLGVLARYCLKNETFAEIVQTKVASVPSSRSNLSRTLTNHNKLLWQYPYTTGIKTGYTRRAGRCLVASASQNGITLISIVLKSNYIYPDSIKLFNYGFEKLIPDYNADILNSNEANIGISNQVTEFPSSAMDNVMEQDEMPVEPEF